MFRSHVPSRWHQRYTSLSRCHHAGIKGIQTCPGAITPVSKVYQYIHVPSHRCYRLSQSCVHAGMDDRKIVRIRYENLQKTTCRSLDLVFMLVAYEMLFTGAVCCVTLLDRLVGDQVRSSRETLHEFDERPAHIVARFICKRLGIQN